MSVAIPKDADTVDTTAAYQALFHPRSIVVIGASNNELKPGGRVLKNIKDNGFEGRLWVVNPKTPDVLGLPTFKTIADLPQGPDLALLAIPSPMVLEAIQDLARIKTGAVIVLTSGFGEKNEAGKQLERTMVEIAAQAGMVLIGPNCSGFLTQAYKGKFAGIIPDLPGGAVDFISGSGATVDYVMERASLRGLSFGNVINLGNSAQMGVEDLLQIYDENYGPGNARILMIYMELVKKPAKLLRHARSIVNKGCMIVGIKSGVTAAGQRAAASHTGAMATSDTAVEALFKKAGIIRVKSRAELIDVCCVLASAKGAVKGHRACIITDAGGPGVMLSDELNRQGMEIPLLKASTRERLGRVLPPESSTANPIDALPTRTAEQIKAILQVLKEEELDTIDIIAVLTGNSGMSDNAPIYQEIINAKADSPIPILPVLSSVITCADKIQEVIRQGHVYFPDEVDLGAALGKAARWRKPEEVVGVPAGYDKAAIAALLQNRGGVLPPDIVDGVLRAAGFKLVPQQEVFKVADLASACRSIGYPLVMKVIGPLHKTDVGGVKLNIGDADQARQAWDDLMTIDQATGVLLQPMVKGIEVIMGVSREGDFGHLVMFGLGGIYAEVLKDVQFALAPLTPAESQTVIRSIRSFALLQGVRGEAGMNVDLLADYLQRLGCLVTDFPQIGELDLNPIKGTGDDLYAVDARIILDAAE
jgi:acetyltransferase